MAGFSVIDAALEGIRLTREKPRIVLLWGLYYVGFIIVLGLIAYATLGAHMSELVTSMQKPPSDPLAWQKLITTVAPFVNIAGPVGMVFQAMFTAAIYRRILRPEDPRMGLRLGMDELRLLAVFALLALVLMAMVFVVQLVVLVTAALPDTPVSVLFGALLMVGGWCAGVVALVRLSLVGAATFAMKRLAVVEGWRLTRHEFWRLFLTYVMATALSVVVLILMQFLLGVIFEVLFRVTGVSVGAGGGPPAMVAFLVLEAVAALIATCAYVILQSPPAAAYAALARPTAAT